ncbi:hypothetical protein CTAYLR_009276 [Chrysophaeum taylorii]|uniref:subtilisin n=1 Tax=Chrysophaeum taylorii TaxID=2483200 RepID=A0AAD7UHW6_9STRA|nr:hypothetical protein CTAYLR_009276 [Chrysophaeum taylorii]
MLLWLLGCALARHSPVSSETRLRETVPGAFCVRLCGEGHRKTVSKYIAWRSGKKRSFSAVVTRHVRRLKTLPALYVHNASDAAVEELRGHSSVCGVASVARVRAARGKADYLAPAGAWWHLDRINQIGLPLDGTLPGAGGAGRNIFLVDTGLDTTHREFAGDDERVVANAASFVEGDEFVAEWGTFDAVANNDVDGHGTFASSMAGGATVGVAPLANLYMVRALDDDGYGSVEWVVSALDYIYSVVEDHGMERTTIASLSLGGWCGSGNVTYCRSEEPLALAVSALAEIGVPVVVAAGNDDDDACFYTPAAARDAITVGASDYTDVVAEWSNYGACVDLVAPGKDVAGALASRPRDDEDDDSHYYYYYAAGDYVDDDLEQLVVMSGTSFSAPLVAGTIALYAEADDDDDDDDDDITTFWGARSLLSATTRDVLFSDPRRCWTNFRFLRTPERGVGGNNDNSVDDDAPCELPADRDYFYYDYDNNSSCVEKSSSSPCDENGTEFDFIMRDTYGDGWNGACFTIENPNCAECETYGGTLRDGALEVRSACVWCSRGGYEITLTAGSWPTEIEWQLGNLTGGAPTRREFTCDALRIPLEHVVDDDAFYYYSPPRDDYSSSEEACDSQTVVDSCEAGLTLFTLELFDSYGDGWNGACFRVESSDCADCPTFAGTFDDGSYITYDVCLECGANYTITAGGGNWDQEISWKFGNLTGGRTTATAFTCADLVAPPPPPFPDNDNDNDNAWGGIDDGLWVFDDDGGGGGGGGASTSCGSDGLETNLSCAAAAANETSFYSLQLVDTYGDGWNGACWSIECSEGCASYSGTLETGSWGFRQLCLDCDANYTISVGGGYWDEEIRWRLGNLTGGGGTVAFSCAALDAPLGNDAWSGGDAAAAAASCGSNNLDTAPNVSCSTNETSFYSLQLVDTYGDGWNGACWTIECREGCASYSGTLEDGHVATRYVCLRCDKNYTITAGGGFWDEEIRWKLGNLTGGATIGGVAATCERLEEPPLHDDDIHFGGGDDDDDAWYDDDDGYPSNDDDDWWAWYFDETKLPRQWARLETTTETCVGFDVDANKEHFFDKFAFVATNGTYVAFDVVDGDVAPGFVLCDDGLGEHCDAYERETTDSSGGVLRVEGEDFHARRMSISARVCTQVPTTYTLFAVHSLNATTSFVQDTTLTMSSNATVVDYFVATTAATIQVAGECALAAGAHPWTQSVRLNASFDPPAARTIFVAAGEYFSLAAAASAYADVDSIRCTVLLAPASLKPTAVPTTTTTTTTKSEARLRAFFTLSGIEVERARGHADVLATAVGSLVGVDETQVVEIAVVAAQDEEARRDRRLLQDVVVVVVAYTIETLFEAVLELTSKITGLAPNEVDAEIVLAAAQHNATDVFGLVLTVSVADHVDITYEGDGSMNPPPLLLLNSSTEAPAEAKKKKKKKDINTVMMSASAVIIILVGVGVLLLVVLTSGFFAVRARRRRLLSLASTSPIGGGPNRADLEVQMMMTTQNLSSSSSEEEESRPK